MTLKCLFRKPEYLPICLLASDLSKRAFSQSADDVSNLLSSLRKLDTAALCDADKSMLATIQAADDDDNNNNNNPPQEEYKPISLMQGLRPLNAPYGDNAKETTTIMAGVARTIQCSQPNDLLAVLDGLFRAQRDECLVINTCDSVHAVAGELFCAEATRLGVAGILVDGPMRDTRYLVNLSSESAGATTWCFAKSVTPYSGTTIHLGQEQVPVKCGGVLVHPGDIVVGDEDGVVVASADTFKSILSVAEEIRSTEAWVKVNVIKQQQNLHSMTNFEDHVKALRNGEPSSLKFK